MAQKTTTITKAHQGPLPPEDSFASYEQTLPGAAERIMAMTEANGEHRREMERRQLEADISHRDQVYETQRLSIQGSLRSDLAGQVIGGIIAIGCVIGAVLTGLQTGNWLIVAAFLCLPVVGMIKAIRGMLDSGSNEDKK